jgi:hypothetical protein
MAVFDEPVEINGHDLILRQDGAIHIHLDMSKSDLVMGGDGSNGEVHLRDGDGVLRTIIAPQFISLRNSDLSVEMVRIDGEVGDITLSGADCAEFFEAADAHEIEPGTVLVVDDGALLRPCNAAYDRRVAGIVSGAGGLRPGVMLGAVASSANRVPVALTGRTFCKVDARYGAVAVGDLLTSSPTAGHAMTASDPARAFGAVIGKALRAHGAGQGLIPVLVALQ